MWRTLIGACGALGVGAEQSETGTLGSPMGKLLTSVRRRPSALALQVGRHRVEYVQEMLDALPAAQRSAVERSPNRIR